jgi:hypothetical protein
MYINCLTLLILSCVLSLAIGQLNFLKRYKNYLSSLLNKAASCFIGIHLLNYGLAKLFNVQFYTPEPNTLFTNLGYLNKDLVYWSSMGVGTSYNYFLGTVECLAAIMLFFKRTNFLGACLALFTLINIFAINLSYDISVKLFTAILLAYCLIICLQYRRIFSLLIIKDNTTFVYKKNYVNFKYSLLFSLAISIYFTICLMYPHLKNNTETSYLKKSKLPGAYQSFYFSLNNNAQTPTLNDTLIFKRFFIHSQGYLITQYFNEALVDYNLKVDTLNKKLVLGLNNTENNWQYNFENDSIITLSGLLNQDSFLLKAKRINLNTLPLLQPEFSWFAD